MITCTLVFLAGLALGAFFPNQIKGIFTKASDKWKEWTAKD